MMKITSEAVQYISQYKSPLGGITFVSNGTALSGLLFDGQKYAADILSDKYEERNLPVFDETKRWLDIYFSGRVPDFTPQLLLTGSLFRQSVWNILLTVAYGHTITYGEIARRVAEECSIQKMSAQAVGGAVGHNPVSIIVPCHRVIGSDGSLTGYAGGIERKRKLLALEHIIV